MNCSDFKQMLDLYIDGELDESQRRALEAHAAQCSSCRDELAAAEQLRKILSHMDDDISVPLPAQAAWRNAVRAEAKRSRMKKIYSICGAVAAVCVLTFGVTAMLGQDVPGAVQRVETDGVSENTAFDDNVSLTSAKTRSVDYIVRSIEAEDLVKASDYLSDVIAEYGGTIEHETEGDEIKVFVQIPGENAVDFISAVDSLGNVIEETVIEVDASAVSVGFCIVITGM